MISLASEMTDGKGRHARGWLFFDAECRFCTQIARRLLVPMQRRGLDVAPLQDPRVGLLLGLSREELLRAIRFILADGSQYSGADAILALAREFWWGRPFAWASRIPGVTPAVRAAYQWIAHSLRCRDQQCLTGQVRGS